jgi:formate dehydrogenase (coenzyme F420) beta subunit
MSLDSQRTEIIGICKRLIDENQVKVVLGFGQGEIDGNAVPRFFRSSEEMESIKWDKNCTPNLAKYLLEKKDKTAIIAKSCDARAVVMYLVEKQIDRDNVYIIGVECVGMTDAGGELSPGCSECTVKEPPIYDVLVKNPDLKERLEAPRENEDIKGDLEQNLERFQDEMKKCILCFTCRQACCGCYCKTCFMDRNIPNWMPAEAQMGSKMTFHLGRAMHIAGRCIECGACERVCPSGVKIRYLVKEITGMCKELYGYTAGMDPDETPALAVYTTDDREIGFLGGGDSE